MIASIIAAVAGLFKIIAELMRQSRDKLLLSLGGTRQQASSLEERIDALQQANRLREKARADINRDPAGGLQHDEFERPEKNGDS